MVSRYVTCCNQVYNNILNTVTTGFSNDNPSGVNNYHDNIFKDVTTYYSFTDNDNMNNAGSVPHNYAPLGFKVYSIDPASDWVYYEKYTEGNSMDCWRKVKKYL